MKLMTDIANGSGSVLCSGYFGMFTIYRTKFTVDIFDGCHPIIYKAVVKFNSQAGSCSEKSRLYSIYSLITKVIDDAIQKYADSLPKNNYEIEMIIPGFGKWNGLGDLCKRRGFDSVERSMRRVLRYLMQAQVCYCDTTFIATVDTLIQLVAMCATKRSLEARRYGDGLCDFCGDKTELSLYLDEGRRPISTNDIQRRLSPRYCSKHKPKISDNSEYRRAVRSKDLFEKEYLRMRRQTCVLSVPRSQSGDDLVDLYIQNYMARFCVYHDEKSKLRRHARKMVDKRITDKKKCAIMLLALGKSQADIARHLNVTQQSVSKIINSVPDEYRLDIKHTCDTVHGQAISSLGFNLDPVLLNALQDPMTTYVELNPDGKLWQERYNEPSKHIGNLSEARAQAIIEAVAICHGKIVSKEMPIVEANGFLFDGYGFAGQIPPIVDAPAFVIRKMSNSVIWPMYFSG